MQDLILKQTKNCRTCGEAKPPLWFSNHKGMKDGLRSDCKVCCAEYARKYREKNPEKIRDYNNGNRDLEKDKEYKRNFRKLNPERQRMYNKKHSEANPEKVRKSSRDGNKKWREANPEKYMLRAAKQRAKNTKVPFDIQLSDIVIPAVCPILDIPLFRGTRSVRANSPSLDKMIPELGYVKGNIMVISNLANTMKSNATWEQCVKLGQFAAIQIEREKINVLLG